MKVPKFLAPIVKEVYKAIKLNRKAKYSWLADILGVSERRIQAYRPTCCKMNYYANSWEKRSSKT